MLKVNNLKFAYKRKGRPVLDDFSLTIDAGGVYGLLGKNGTGKTTLLYLIAGLLTPKSGDVIFLGENTRRRLPSTLGEMFIVPEEFAFPSISLKKYVSACAGFYPRFSMDDLRNHLATFELDADLNLGELSMGQKKKAMMSFALACNTRLLLMDEPTNGLDIPGKSAFRRFIAQNMTDERTILISTHQTRDIDKLIDHVIIMDNSNILFDRSVYETIRHLKFMNTSDRALIGQALFSQPSIEGASIVLPNNDGDETELNLETLFELALANPGKLNEIFTDNTDKI